MRSGGYDEWGERMARTLRCSWSTETTEEWRASFRPSDPLVLPDYLRAAWRWVLEQAETQVFYVKRK